MLLTLGEGPPVPHPMDEAGAGGATGVHRHGSPSLHLQGTPRLLLRAPPPLQRPGSPWLRLRWVTGNGLVVAVDPLQGMVGVWRAHGGGLAQLAGALSLGDTPQAPAPSGTVPSGTAPSGIVRSGSSPPAGAGDSPEPPFLLAAGRWWRRFRLGDGTPLVERGLVLEEAAVLLVEWEREAEGAAPSGTRVEGTGAWMEGTGTGTEETVTRMGEAGSRMEGTGAPREEDRILPRFLQVPEGEGGGLEAGPLSLPPGGRVRIALLGGEVDPDRARRLLGDPVARARVRAGRGTSFPGEAFALRSGDEMGHGTGLAEALEVLDEASLGPSAPLFIRGTPGSPPPRTLEGTGLMEYGLACLATGRWERVEAILASGAAAAGGAPLPFLLLAARWCLWTARPLPGGGEELDRAVEVAMEDARTEPKGGPARAGAAFPPFSGVLGELADGLEGVGDQDRPGRLRQWADELRRPHRGSNGGRLRLPVLGSPPPGSTPGLRPSRASLPPPGAFASLQEPAILPHRTLHAARLVRSWMDGILGVEPDAASGRLSLTLDFRDMGWPPAPLVVENLRVGDARVLVGCRGAEGVLTFRVAQEAGRVPLNLIFQARLPIAQVQRVRLGEESVEVEVRKDTEGVLVRCQFPLDSERRLTVEG